MILSAQSIRHRCKHPETGRSSALGRPVHGFVRPFSERTTAFGMTFAVDPASYDIRVRETISLAPGSFNLISSLEELDMPPDLSGRVADKSTWARRGLALQNTFIDPGWHGFLTMEVTHRGAAPVQLREGMPIAQIVFELLDQPTALPYRGKYDAQPAHPVGPIAGNG